MKIALMGSAPGSVRLGPFHDQSYAAFQQGKTQAYPPAPHAQETWEIWGCSPGLFGVAPRATRWFELHRWEPGQEWFSPEYCQFLRQFNGPVYTGGPVEEVPNHVVYPLQRMEAEFSSFFLTSSLSLMAAEAILVVEQIRKARRGEAQLPPFVNQDELGKPDSDDVIGFWGVDMRATEEYARQLPGCWFFGLEIARRGIGLYYPPESDLFCPEPVYGICEWDHAYIKATTRMRELNTRAQQNQQTITQLQAQQYADAGVRGDLEYQIKTWMNPWRLPPGKVIHMIPGSGLGVSVAEEDGAPVKASGAVDMGAIPYTGRTAAD